MNKDPNGLDLLDSLFLVGVASAYYAGNFWFLGALGAILVFKWLF